MQKEWFFSLIYLNDLNIYIYKNYANSSCYIAHFKHGFRTPQLQLMNILCYLADESHRYLKREIKQHWFVLGWSWWTDQKYWINKTRRNRLDTTSVAQTQLIKLACSCLCLCTARSIAFRKPSTVIVEDWRQKRRRDYNKQRLNCIFKLCCLQLIIKQKVQL